LIGVKSPDKRVLFKARRIDRHNQRLVIG